MDQPSSPQAARVVVTIPEADAEIDSDAVSGTLWAMGTIGIEERSEASATVLIAGFDDIESAKAAQAVVGGTVGEVEADAGLDEWRRWAEPIRAGGYFVVPTWLDNPTPAGATRIDLEPGRAFGSGSHLSTQLALEALASVDLQGARVLDMGCGTGVLAVASALAGAAEVVAVDRDPEAVQTTVDNSRLNGVAERVVAQLAASPSTLGRFDVVLANLLLADLEPMADELRDSVADDGLLITTGHLVTQRARLTEALRMNTRSSTERGEWSLVVAGLHR